MLRKIVAFFAILPLLSACSSSGRRPASDEELGRLRTATYDLSDQNKLIVIGIDKTGQVPVESTFDFAVIRDSAGKPFRLDDPPGTAIPMMEPKYVLLTNSSGIDSVYSFELNYAFPRRDVGGGLPPKLLEVKRAHLDLVFHAIVDAFYTAASFTPIVPLSNLMQSYRQDKEKVRLAQADYLRKVIDTMIEKEPDATSYFGGSVTREQLLTLAAALKERFNEESPYGGILITQKNEVPYYQKLEAKQSAEIADKAGKLVKWANQCNLVVMQMTEEFYMLLEDRNSPPRWDTCPNLLHIMRSAPDPSPTHAQEITISTQSLVPKGLYSLRDRNAPLSLIDYDSIKQDPTTYRLVQQAKVVENEGLYFIPIPFISVSVHAAEGIVHFVARKQGRTLFDKVVGSYAELAAIADMGISSFDISDLYTEVFLQDLADLSVPQATIDSFRQKLQSRDSAEIQSTLNEIQSMLASSSAQSSRLLGGASGAQLDRLKAFYMDRLIHLMSSSHEITKLNRSLNQGWHFPFF